MYGIMRIEKRGRAAVHGLQLEANRTKEDHERGRDFDRSDIDWTLTGENMHLIKCENWNTEITKQIKEAGVKERKDSIVMLDGVYTATGEFFEGMSPKELYDFFDKCLEFHVKEYCQGDWNRVINAVIHLDETTPHMQVASVPIIEDEKGKHLSAKMIMGNRSEYRQRQDRFFDEVSKAYGLDRGELVEYQEKEKDGRIILSRAEDAKVHTTKRAWQMATLEESHKALEKEIEGQLTQIEANRQDMEALSMEYIEKAGELNNIEGDIEHKSEELKELSQKITNEKDSYKKAFERIAEKASSHELPSPKYKTETVIDEEGGLLKKEKSHKEHYLAYKVPNKEAAQELADEIKDLYKKHYVKESLEELSEGYKRTIKDQHDKMLAEAHETIERANSTLQDQERIIREAQEEAKRIKEKAEKQARQKTAEADKVRQEADKAFEQALLVADEIKAEAYSQIGQKDLYEEINARLGLIPLKEKVEARDRMEALYQKCAPFMDDAEKKAYKDLDTEAMNKAWLDRTSGRPKSGVGSPHDFADLRDAVEAFAAIKDRKTDFKELVEEIKEELGAPHIHHIDISR